MKRKMTRILAALLAVLLTLGMLAACGNEGGGETEGGSATLPPQEAMPAQQLELALRRMEYGMLCSALSAAKQIETLEGRAYRGDTAYIADLDGDGWEELVYSSDALTFTTDPKRSVTYSFAQSGYTYYTDKDGKFYRVQSNDDAYVTGDEGNRKWNEELDTSYACWNGTEWEVKYAYAGHAVYNQKGHDASGNVTYDTENPVENDQHGLVDGQEVGKAELDAKLKEIGMTKITSGSDDYVKNSYSAAYAESLLEGLDVYLAKRFKGYNGMIASDIDADGAVEAVFVVPLFDQLWRDSVVEGEGVNSSAGEALQSHLPAESQRTAIVVADQQGDQMVFTARCAMAEIRTTTGSVVKMSKGFLWLDNTPVYLSGAFSMLREGDLMEALAAYAESYGYSNCVLKSVDVTDFEGAEYLCLCKKGSGWYALVFVFEDGNPKVVLNRELATTGLYLMTDDAGDQSLLTYSERKETTWNGQTYTGYEYKLFRIGTDAWPDSLDYKTVGYYDNNPNNSALDEFRGKLNAYLEKSKVICDPYKLGGNEWMLAEDAEFGTVPGTPQQGGQQGGEQGGQQGGQQTTEPTQPSNEKTGYVHLNDPGAWLNVRQGPGTQYPCVLSNPYDPMSFVMVANGAAVTVLESVTTTDWANPVWLKIRVTYGGKEYVGYSSKNFINIME